MNEGYSVEGVQDAVKGEELIRSSGYDIIFLDSKMPVLNGLDILKKLKADNVRKRVFIITGRPYIEQILKEKNLSDMVSGIITKPINFEALLEKIKEA